MPELPEVEAARKALHESCCGLTILEAIVADDPLVIDGVSPSDLRTALTSRKILNVFRKGKNLWLELDQRPWPTFQFGMTGAFYIKGKEITKYKRSAVSDKEEWPSKFSKVFLKLDNELEVSFTDKRRLARIRLINDPSTTPPLSELGPDAYLELPDGTTFTSCVLKKKCPIKALLLDQSFLAGIGNWVADEILYQARIHPEQTASSLSEDECIELHKCIQKVIRLSVEVDADSERFPPNWIFHYHWNKKPGKVDGEKVEFITVGGRTSAYVPALQKCTTETSKRKNGVGRKNPEAKDTNVEVKRSSKRNQDEEAPAPEQAGDSKKTKRKKGSTSRETVVVSESKLEKASKEKTKKIGKGKTRNSEGKEETKVNKSTAAVSNTKKNVEKEKKKEKTAGTMQDLAANYCDSFLTLRNFQQQSLLNSSKIHFNQPCLELWTGASLYRKESSYKHFQQQDLGKWSVVYSKQVGLKLWTAEFHHMTRETHQSELIVHPKHIPWRTNSMMSPVSFLKDATVQTVMDRLWSASLRTCQMF